MKGNGEEQQRRAMAWRSYAMARQDQAPQGQGHAQRSDGVAPQGRDTEVEMPYGDRDEYGYQRYVFRLACAYGLAKTAPERKLGEVVLFDEDDKPEKRPYWLWNQERRRWRS